MKNDMAYESAIAAPRLQNPYADVETILVVEDDHAVRALVQRMLHRFGFRVLGAQSGEEALSIVDTQAEAIQLVLADIILPDLGGPEVMKRVLIRSGHIKVLFMSGHTNHPFLKHRSLQGGANFIQKPFSGQALAIKIRQLLDS